MSEEHICLGSLFSLVTDRLPFPSSAPLGVSRIYTMRLVRCTLFAMISRLIIAVNLWSHGLGSLAFSIVPLSCVLGTRSRFWAGSTEDLLMPGIFFASVTVCFLFSTRYIYSRTSERSSSSTSRSFHILMNHSPSVWQLCSKLDHLGIVLVIWGSTIPSAHFGFYNDRAYCYLYWILVWASIFPVSVY